MKKHLGNILTAVLYLLMLGGAFFWGYCYGWSTFPEHHPEYKKQIYYPDDHAPIIPFGYEENMKWLEIDKTIGGNND